MIGLHGITPNISENLLFQVMGTVARGSNTALRFRVTRGHVEYRRENENVSWTPLPSWSYYEAIGVRNDSPALRARAMGRIDL